LYSSGTGYNKEMDERPTREQLPFYNRFVRCIDNESFMADVGLLRDSKIDILESTHENVEVFNDGSVNADEIPSPLHQFMLKYSLPIVMEDFVFHFIRHETIDLSKLRNGVYLVDDKSMEASGRGDNELNYHGYVNDTMHNKYIHITLAIPVHATITQINDTISEHKQFIRDRQTGANNDTPVSRVRSEFYAERDKEVMDLYRQGYRPREIASKISGRWRGIITAPMISDIIYRRRKQKR